MEKICVLYCPVWSYASMPSVSRRIRWYGSPAGVRVGMGADQIQRPFVQGFTVGPTLNPASFEAAAPASWFRMKLLPCLARPHTASTPTGPFTARRQSSASSPNVNFFEPSSNRSRWRGLPRAGGAPDLGGVFDPRPNTSNTIVGARRGLRGFAREGARDEI